MNGLAPTPEDENPLWAIVWRLGIVAFATAFASYWLYKIGRLIAPPKWTIVLFVGLALFIVFALYATLHSIIVSRRFRRPSRALFGELLDCKVIHDDGTVYWKITYRFLSPAGRMIEGEWGTEGTITNFADRETPAPGTRIAICYIDDKIHRVL